MEADRGEQVGDVVVVQPVEGVPACPADADQTLLAQEPQLMGGRARRDAGRRDELLDGLLLLEHGPEQPEPARCAERSHRLGKGLGLLEAERPAWVLMLGAGWHDATIDVPSTDAQLFICSVWWRSARRLVLLRPVHLVRALSRAPRRIRIRADFEHGHHHSGHDHEHAHSHGLIDRSILRSREGVRAVVQSLAVLAVTAAAELAIFFLSNSVALLGDLIHNFGDALTAVPLGIAFVLRSFRGEKRAGLVVVGVIFVSACVALYETVNRFVHPEHVTHLWVLAAAGVIGFAGNEVAARIRLRAGARLSSPALIADGNHARVDGFVSLGVVASAVVVAAGARVADPIVGLVLTLVILKIAWDSWRTVSSAEPGDLHERTSPGS